MGSVSLFELKKKTEKYKRDKNDVLKKVVRAKLTSTWEGGGVGGKNIQTYYFLIRGAILTTTNVGNRVNFSSTVGILLRWSKEPIFNVWSKSDKYQLRYCRH